MSGFVRRLRGAAGTGVTWAAAWAVGGVMLGVSSLLLPGLPWEFFFRVFDAPLPTMAIPGFVGGAIFSGVLSIGARGRGVDDLSMTQVTAWGALGGLLLSVIPLLLIAADGATKPPGTLSAGQITVVLALPFTAFSALSAAGTLWLARRAQRVTTLSSEPLGALPDSDSTPELTAPTTSPSARSPSETAPISDRRSPHQR